MLNFTDYKKIKKDELIKLQRNAVVMRMIEYTQKMNNNDIYPLYEVYIIHSESYSRICCEKSD